MVSHTKMYVWVIYIHEGQFLLLERRSMQDIQNRLLCWWAICLFVYAIYWLNKWKDWCISLLCPLATTGGPTSHGEWRDRWAAGHIVLLQNAILYSLCSVLILPLLPALLSQFPQRALNMTTYTSTSSWSCPIVSLCMYKVYKKLLVGLF